MWFVFFDLLGKFSLGYGVSGKGFVGNWCLGSEIRRGLFLYGGNCSLINGGGYFGDGLCGFNVLISLLVGLLVIGLGFGYSGENFLLGDCFGRGGSVCYCFRIYF